MVIVILCIIAVIVGFLFFTPYPFVWLLRFKKEEARDKSPRNIDEIKKDLSIEKNLRYPSKYPNATFDFYQGKERLKEVIVWIHGGSFISGSSEGAKNFAMLLAEKGYAVAAMNYAYAPKHAFPTQLKQVDELLCYLKDRYPDIEGVVLGGDSAGANIAASYASFYQNAHHPMKLELKNPMEIRAMLLFCGPYDFTENVHREEFKEFKTFMKYIGWSYLGHRNWEKRNEKCYASPLLNLHESYPPVYLCDGKKFSFLWQAKKLEQALKERNIITQSRYYEDMPHEFQFEYKKYESEAMQVYVDTVEFLEKILKK